jgi:hypothetical protein
MPTFFPVNQPILANRRRVGGGDSFVGETWYFDPSAAGSSETGLTNNPFLSTMNAIDAKCNKQFTTPIRLLGRTSGNTPDTERVDFSLVGQMVTAADKYLLIQPDTGHRHSGIFTTAKLHYDVNRSTSAQAGTVMNIDKDYVWLDGLQFTINNVADTSEIIYWGATTHEPTGLIGNCIIKGPGGTQAVRGISVIYGVHGYNLVIYGLGTGGNTAAIKNHGSSRFYNCTLINPGGSAIITFDHSLDLDGVGAAFVKNVYAGGSTFHDFDITNGTLTQTNCVSADTTAAGTNPLTNKPVNTTHFTNVTAGSEEYSLPGTSALLASGADLSADGALNFIGSFNTNIAGATRSSWNRGAF